MISAQGYIGLGSPEYAERLLDACSDPGLVSRRAGKKRLNGGDGSPCFLLIGICLHYLLICNAKKI
jgi:hypothetical protein